MVEDPWFQEIGGTGTIIGIASLAVTIALALWIYNRQKTPRTLDSIPHFGISLLPRDGRQTPGLRITLDDSPLERPFTCSLELINTGKRSIQPSDYVRPVAVYFSDATCVRAIVSRSSDPESVPLNESVLPSPASAFYLPRYMLNPGEWFEISMVCDGQLPPGEPLITVKLNEQSRGSRDLSLRRQAFLGLLTLIVAISLGIFVGQSGIFWSKAGQEDFYVYLYVAARWPLWSLFTWLWFAILVVAAATMALLAVSSTLRSRRRTKDLRARNEGRSDQS